MRGARRRTGSSPSWANPRTIEPRFCPSWASRPGCRSRSQSARAPAKSPTCVSSHAVWKRNARAHRWWPLRSAISSPSRRTRRSLPPLAEMQQRPRAMELGGHVVIGVAHLQPPAAGPPRRCRTPPGTPTGGSADMRSGQRAGSDAPARPRAARSRSRGDTPRRPRPAIRATGCAGTPWEPRT